MPRCEGVGLGLLGLCCCLKNGLSKRPGGRDDTKAKTGTHNKRERKKNSDAPQQRREEDRKTEGGEDCGKKMKETGVKKIHQISQSGEMKEKGEEE